jgi:hypothetical protein
MGIGFQFAGRLTGIEGWSSPMIGGGTWHCWLRREGDELAMLFLRI